MGHAHTTQGVRGPEGAVQVTSVDYIRSACIMSLDLAPARHVAFWPGVNTLNYCVGMLPDIDWGVRKSLQSKQ